MELVKTSLPIPATLDYIRDVLGEGLTLSHELLHHLNFQNGRCWAYLPPMMPPDQIVEFRFGKGVSGARASLTRDLGSWLSEQLTSIAVFEAATARPQDPWLRNPARTSGLGFMVLGNELYYFLHAGGGASRIAAQNIDRTIGAAGGAYPPMVCILSELPSTLTAQIATNRIQIDLEAIKYFAVSAYRLIIDAYDGESFIVWEKN